jgi:hypothetical protein
MLKEISMTWALSFAVSAYLVNNKCVFTIGKTLSIHSEGSLSLSQIRQFIFCQPADSLIPVCSGCSIHSANTKKTDDSIVSFCVASLSFSKQFILPFISQFNYIQKVCTIYMCA